MWEQSARAGLTALPVAFTFQFTEIRHAVRLHSTEHVPCRGVCSDNRGFVQVAAGGIALVAHTLVGPH